MGEGALPLAFCQMSRTPARIARMPMPRHAGEGVSAKARVRELLVEYILSEFGISAFGVKEIAPKREISDKMIKKCQKARRKGF